MLVWDMFGCGCHRNYLQKWTRRTTVTVFVDDLVNTREFVQTPFSSYLAPRIKEYTHRLSERAKLEKEKKKRYQVEGTKLAIVCIISSIGTLSLQMSV